MAKHTNLKLFSSLAKKAYKISKKRKLGWTWHDAQRWTSQNLYQEFKGEYPSKVRVTDVKNTFQTVIDKKPRVPIHRRQIPMPKNCYSAFHLTDADVEDINYWFLEDVVFGKNGRLGFNDDLNVDVQIDGIISTGIVKKGSLISLQYVVEFLRRKYKDVNTSSFPDITFKRLVINPSAGRDNPCNTYLLITEVDSIADNRTPEDTIVIQEKDLTPEEQAVRKEERKLREAEEKKKVTKRQIVKKERPSMVETPEEPQAKPKPKEIKKEKPKTITLTREDNIRIILADLKQDWKDGIYTTKEYKKMYAQIISKLEKGGEI